MTWITDENGNRCSVERWGSKEKAQEALDSLIGCSRCSDCSGCYDCSRCSRCSDCSDCSDCSGCYDFKNAAPGENASDPVVVPAIPDIHKAVYKAASQPEALRMDSCHTCEKTHCRAGWIVTLAGEAGKKLESRFDTLLAAMKIYDASDPNYKISPCRFFDDNEDALEDMRKLAKR